MRLKTFLLLTVALLIAACSSPEKKAQSFIKDLKKRTPNATVLKTNLQTDSPYVLYMVQNPYFEVFRHSLKKNEDVGIVRGGSLLCRIDDTSYRFIYCSAHSQLKVYDAESEKDSILAPSPVTNAVLIPGRDSTLSKRIIYKRLGKINRISLDNDSLASIELLPDNAQLFAEDNRIVYYSVDDELHRLDCLTEQDVVLFKDVKAYYPVGSSNQCHLVDAKNDVYYWDYTTDKIDTLFFSTPKYITGYELFIENPENRRFFTKTKQKYVIGLEKKRTIYFFSFDPNHLGGIPEYLGSDYSDGRKNYSFEHESRGPVITLANDYYFTDYDWDGNILKQKLTVNGFIDENRIHESMILTYSDQSVSYVNGSKVESYNVMFDDTIQIKSGKYATSNAGELDLSISMTNIFPTPDRKRLIINASNPGLFQDGEYLILFNPDERIYTQIDFGTSISRERDRFRVKHVDNSVSYYNRSGERVGANITDSVFDWLFDVD